MLVSKKKLNPYLIDCMVKESGFREMNIMQKSRWVTTSGKGRYITFTMKNPDYKKTRFETTKSYGCTFDTKTCRWVN